ncbi:MAG: hypothetical protein JWQ09_3144 [Segetibacter sp.]|nr:hypothetical protein [Segetibacter sp.]
MPKESIVIYVVRVLGTVHTVAGMEENMGALVQRAKAADKFVQSMPVSGNKFNNAQHMSEPNLIKRDVSFTREKYYL